MPHTRPWLLALILLAIYLVLLVWCYRHVWHGALPHLPKRLRRLHPGTPDDCLTAAMQPHRTTVCW